MKQVIFIILLVCGLYFVYVNWNKINTTITTDIKNERTVQTIKAVNEGRNSLNKEAEDILNDKNN